MRRARLTGMMRFRALVVAGFLLTAADGVGLAQTMSPAPTPAVGSKAPAFTLTAVDGAAVTLAAELRQRPVVLIVGRGWPGYQCPFCTKQFAEFRSHAKDFETAGARVLWVYPGPADGLTGHAQTFAGTDVPPTFRILVDPAYTFTMAYGLRWDAPSETAYPATFVIDQSGTVRFAQVSREHGGRTLATDVLTAMAAMPRR